MSKAPRGPSPIVVVSNPCVCVLVASGQLVLQSLNPGLLCDTVGGSVPSLSPCLPPHHGLQPVFGSAAYIYLVSAD